MLNKSNSEQDEMILLTLNQALPQDHLLRKINKFIDFDFIYPLVEDKYSNVGRGSIDPVVLFKLVFIQKLFGIKSMRQTIKECEVNIAYRWFLGIGFASKVPHFTTFGKNYERRFKGTDIFEQIFINILKQAMSQGLVDGNILFTDSTHIKANASVNKYENKIKKVAKKTNNKLLQEINDQREEIGKKPLKDNGDDDEIDKNTKISKTDPDSGYMHRSRKEKGFMYLDHRTVDNKYNIIVDTKITPGNVHDSTPYIEILKNIKNKTGLMPKAVGLDSGYNTRAILRYLEDNKIFGVIAHRRFPRNKNLKHKYYFHYDQQLDTYICPNDKKLTKVNITRDGYKVYRNKTACLNCPITSECLGASGLKYRSITRHINDDIKDKATKNRLSPFGQYVSKRRRETVERSFGDSKQNHGYRYAMRRGIIKNQDDSLVLCAVQNMKKIATVLSKIETVATNYSNNLKNHLFYLFKANFLNFI